MVVISISYSRMIISSDDAYPMEQVSNLSDEQTLFSESTGRVCVCLDINQFDRADGAVIALADACRNEFVSN